MKCPAESLINFNCWYLEAWFGLASLFDVVSTFVGYYLRELISFAQVTCYNWSSLTIQNISNKYTVTVRNKFDTLQETSERATPNDEYENFVTTHMEAAAECIATQPRPKCTVPWESLVIKKKSILTQ